MHIIPVCLFIQTTSSNPSNCSPKRKVDVISKHSSIPIFSQFQKQKTTSIWYIIIDLYSCTNEWTTLICNQNGERVWYRWSERDYKDLRRQVNSSADKIKGEKKKKKVIFWLRNLHIARQVASANQWKHNSYR